MIRKNKSAVMAESKWVVRATVFARRDLLLTDRLSDQRWNYEFVKLLSQVMATAFTSRPPPYAAILDLDRKLRDFHVPPHLRLTWTGQESSDSLLWVKRWVVLSNKEWGKYSSLNSVTSYWTLE